MNLNEKASKLPFGVKFLITSVISIIVITLSLSLPFLFGKAEAETLAPIPDTSATENLTSGEKPYLQIVASNLKYEDYLYIAYAVSTNLDSDMSLSDVRMLFWNEGQTEYTLGSEGYSSGNFEPNGKTITADGVTYDNCGVFFSEGIAAKEIGDTVFARAYITDSDGNVYYSNAVKYSVLDYVYSRRQDSNVTAKQTRLYNRILTYGANAQILFEHKTDRLVTGHGVKLTVSGGFISDGFVGGVYLEGESVILTVADTTRFLRWENSKGERVSTSPTFTLTVDKNSVSETYTAVFSDSSEPENLIYNKETPLYLVYNSENTSSDTVNEIRLHFSEKNISPEIIDVSASAYDGTAYTHEIVIGSTDREISVAAYDRLERLGKSSEEIARYCFYSNGSSLAVAYDFDYGGFTEKIVSELFKEKYIMEELFITPGIAEESCFDLYERLGEEDLLKLETAWSALAEELGEGSDGVVGALKSFYELYDGEKILTWLAGLYDSDICVCRSIEGAYECNHSKFCGTGGFYYSNSARDHAGFLPDAESIVQALSIIANCGITERSEYTSIVPSWMAEEICAYLYNMQAEDGFFYHPQWGESISYSRRGRDLNWCTQVLSTYGVSTRYTSAVSAALNAELTNRLGSSSVAAVSKAIAVSDASVPEHLATVENFKAYLISLDIPNNSYSAGNTLSAQGSQILARGQEYGDVLIEHLNECQYDNGTWHSEVNYYAINGVMKISGSYERWSAPMPNAEKICRAAFAAICSDEEVSYVVDVWNPWVAVNSVLDNIRRFGAGEEKAEEIRVSLYADIENAILASKESLMLFRKDDGSFSYGKKYSSATSQGVSVAVPGSVEGDVNASAMSTNNFTYEIFELMGTSRVPYAGNREKLVFLTAINNLAPVEKVGVSSEIGNPISFDFDTLGEAPADVTVSDNGRTVVISDTRSGEGNVLRMSSDPDGNDYITMNATGLMSGATCQVFEGEFCFESFARSNQSFRLEMGREGEKNNVYRIEFNSTGSRINLYERPSYSNSVPTKSLGVGAKIGEWFKLRVEYYVGTADSIRIKIYFNDALAAVTDCYYDGWEDGDPTTVIKQARLYALYDSDIELLVDNLHCYNSDTAYTPEPLAGMYCLNTNVDKDLLN